MENNPKHSENVNAMNGCLSGCLHFFGQTVACLLILVLAPCIGILVLYWCVIARMLGPLFPGLKFSPIKQLWDKLCAWVDKHTGMDLESVLIFSALFLIAGAAIRAIVSLFTGRK